MVIKRVATLVCHWTRGGFLVRDYVRRRRHRVNAAEYRVLDCAGNWTGEAEIEQACTDLPRAVVRGAVRRLHRRGLLEAADDPPSPGDRVADAWRSWTPDAAVLHFATKDLRPIPLRRVRAAARDRLEIEEFPAGLKTEPGARHVALPGYERQSPVARLLLARRTWRQFGRGAVTLREVSTLLGLTWGIQGWMEISDRIRSPLKTSPSGGACHSIEVYLVAARVRGLPAGIYHYCPDRHLLEVVRDGVPRTLVGRMLEQPWFADCAAVFFMTSVFERVRWKYPSARAYRVLLLEAGHFCQSFCLIATALGLAPFSTAAFADSFIERRLRIDGIREGVIYAAGIGRRPPPHGLERRRGDIRSQPPITLPTHLAVPRSARQRGLHHGNHLG